MAQAAQDRQSVRIMNLFQLLILVYILKKISMTPVTLRITIST